ncbi:hypothetical protein PR202_gb23139 [Eleusine coracana subsp. coracana]|uniref:Uncharacterized protein n=1 Tax=Eleusine coracana subsp. coracana TaxID=191504 RepID=A0AAV5FI17_ELECO|nr:hypothetical protein PR202_gb23139 [Eleusine coracana subsp. coracana]
MASLAILLLLARISASIAISSNNNYYISRSSQQMIVASVAPLIVPDADGQQSAQQPFLTSPSGSYAAYLRRAADGNGGGGLGGDACYVQIQQAGAPTGSVWESDCTPVGGADGCDLAFSPVGLELFAGGHSLWDTGVDADPATLSLDDDGDMSILSKDGVMVWRASGEPWTGQQCGAGPAPLPASTSSSTDAVSPLSAISAKLVTPPAATLAGTTGSTDDFSFGDQLALPPVDDTPVTAPDVPAQPPVDAVPEQPLAPPPPADLTDPSTPPAYTLPDSPDLPLAPPHADVSPDLPLVAPPPADVSPDQPLYSSPPPVPALPPFGIPLAPPPGTGETSPDTPLPGATTPPAHGEPFSTPPPGGLPHKQGSQHHELPVGASPPLPDTLGPSGHGEGAAGLHNGGGQPQQGVFGQQPQLLDSEGHPLPLEDSAAGRSSSERGRVGIVLAALAALCFGF